MSMDVGNSRASGPWQAKFCPLRHAPTIPFVRPAFAPFDFSRAFFFSPACLHANKGPMPVFTIIVGLVLDLLGIAGFLVSGAITALIPSVFGTIILVCGILAFIRPAWRKHSLHVAAAISALGFIAIIGRSGSQFPALLTGAATATPPLALALQLVFALLCLLYFAVCFRSFLQARMNKSNQPIE